MINPCDHCKKTGKYYGTVECLTCRMHNSLEDLKTSVEKSVFKTDRNPNYICGEHLREANRDG